MQIALDAMGGDQGPAIVVPAALRATAQYPNLSLILVGDEAILMEHLRQHQVSPPPRIRIHHASEVVEMGESPTQALRYKKDSSLRVAMNLVKQGEAQACVSAGNTGALMATAHFVLKMLPQVMRPAILGRMPTCKNSVRMLDLGANVDCNAEHLFQFAIMGSVVAETVDGIKNPKVALLNIGEEEIKGNEQVKTTARLLAETDVINYVGYIEADAIFSGDVDVVVSDGFVGNIALKASEGSAKLIGYFIKRAFQKNLWNKFTGLLTLPALRAMKHDIDPTNYNGACLIGLQGIVVKSHGGTTIAGFTNAVVQAMLQIEHDVLHKIQDEITTLLQKASAT